MVLLTWTRRRPHSSTRSEPPVESCALAGSRRSAWISRARRGQTLRRLWHRVEQATCSARRRHDDEVVELLHTRATRGSTKGMKLSVSLPDEDVDFLDAYDE